jgi:hypothetical protein
MRKINFCLLTGCMLLFVTACRKPLKNVDDYFPEVTSVSAVLQDDGSVQVTGRIESAGKARGSFVDYAGFCMSTSNDPTMLMNQKIGKMDGTEFTAVYPQKFFDQDSTYYFRTWARNDYGYSYGNTIILDSITVKPVTPPCSLSVNYLKVYDVSQAESYYYVEKLGTDNSFKASTMSRDIAFKFGSNLSTRIFKTKDGTPGYGEVNVKFLYGGNYEYLSTGSNVYVNKSDSVTFDISICDALWTVNTFKGYFNTRVIVKK